MATFEEQIEALTSLTIDGSSTPSQADLTQFIADGVMDVTNRCLAANPSEFNRFARESTKQSSDGFDLGNATIISVLRESGTDDDWRECSEISSGLRSRAASTSSIYYASKFNPVYYKGSNGAIHVLPTPGSGADEYKIVYVNNSPIDNDGNPIAYGDSDIGAFPEDKVHLVVIYAAMKALIAKQSASTINVTTSVPSSPSLSDAVFIESSSLNTTYSSTPTLPSAPSFNYINAVVGDLIKPTASQGDMAALSASAPVYVAPTLTLGTFPSLTWALPSTPIAPSISTTSVAALGTAPAYIAPILALEDTPTVSDLDIVCAYPVIPSLSDVVNVDTSGLTPPTFTPPAMNTPDFADANTWINTEEDSEMLASRMQVIQSQIGEYSAKMQEAQAQFQASNTDFQADLQIAIQNAQQANAQDGEKLQKYSAEIQRESAEVNKQVQEWQQNFQKTIQLWQQTRQTDLQKHQSDMQSALNDFNEANVEYQAELQKKIQDAQLTDAGESRKLQKFSNEVQSYSTDVNSTISSNQAQITEWQQENSLKLQKHQADAQVQLHKFNEAQVAYQEDVARKTQNLQKDLQVAIKNADLEMQSKVKNLDKGTQIELQNAVNNFQKDVQEYGSQLQRHSQDMDKYKTDINKNIQEYTSRIQKDVHVMQTAVKNNEKDLAKYQAEIASYQAEVAKETQEQNLKVQQYQGLYAQLKAEYDGAYAIMAPKQRKGD